MDIIISGDPKSGNTWATRLIAECLNSPVVGYYNKPENNEIAIEGLDRTGKFKVYKSHDLKSNILKTNPAATIITIRRDPRETLASAYRFFEVRSYWSKYPGNQHFPLKQFYKLLDITFPWKRNNSRRILHAFIKGDWRVHPALGVSWVNYYTDSLKSTPQSYHLSYEKLIKDPINALKPIIQSIDPESVGNIPDAVSNQSFDSVKRKFRENGSFDKANFLKSGKTDSWKALLTDSEVKTIEKSAAPLMRNFGYRMNS